MYSTSEGAEGNVLSMLAGDVLRDPLLWWLSCQSGQSHPQHGSSEEAKCAPGCGEQLGGHRAQLCAAVFASQRCLLSWTFTCRHSEVGIHFMNDLVQANVW